MGKIIVYWDRDRAWCVFQQDLQEQRKVRLNQIGEGMFQQQEEDRQSPEGVFLSRFHTLSQMLLEDNYANMRNLSQANHNFNQIFSYLKGVLRTVLLKCDRLQERITELEEQLRKFDQNNPVLRSTSSEDYSLNLGEAGAKLRNFVPLIPRQATSFSDKLTVPVRSKKAKQSKSKTSNNPEHIRKEYEMIQTFICKNLSSYLVEDKLRQSQIPKDIIVRSYERWAERVGHTMLVSKKMIVKMQITNELKKLFPNLDHNQKFYLGIAFKKELVENCSEKRQEECFNVSQQRRDVVDEQLFEADSSSKSEYVVSEDLQNLQIEDYDFDGDCLFSGDLWQ